VVPQKPCADEPFFYFSTPEIMPAWLRIPLVNFVLNNPDFFRHPTNKHALQELGGPLPLSATTVAQ
jgi:hypothetical protein